jgi:cytochrome c peroxidase
MNAFGHLAQFWDGRAADVEEQAKGPVLNPVEMAMPSAEVVVATLKSIPGYVTAFKKAFPKDKDPVTYDNFAKAVGAFERQLSTPSRFDKFLKGDDKALTAKEKKGFKTFISTGCTMCHNGALLGASMYQKVGLVKAWPNQKDQGRFDLTKNEADRMMFKVPSLRNIEKTGPYFHDGQTKDLATAFKMMAEYQLGRQLSAEDTTAIVTFLGALTAEPAAEYLETPSLPKSGPKTPAPNPN